MRPLLILLALLLAATGLPAAEPVGDPQPGAYIIVHATTATAGLTRERVVDLLTGRVATMPGGGRVVLVLSHGVAGESAVRDLTARDVSRLVRGWKRLVFGSGGSLPLTAADDRAAIELVGRTPDGLLPLAGPAPEDLPPGLRAVPIP